MILIFKIVKFHVNDYFVLELNCIKQIFIFLFLKKLCLSDTCRTDLFWLSMS